jgi:clan AA aspartic protease (TIGR02281 family)
LICRRCRTNNPESSVYCSSCGSPLLRNPAKRIRIPWYLAAAGSAILISLGIVLYVLLQNPPPPEAARSAETPGKPAAEAVPKADRVSQFLAGEITVQDSSGAVVSRLAASVVRGGWVALPIWSLFDGGQLSFGSRDSGFAPVERGFWVEGDPIALWLVDSPVGGEAPQLAVWRPQIPLRWQPLSTDDEAFRVTIDSVQKAGSFARVPLPPEARGPGVLIQDGQISGWSFGDQPGRGYLWDGPEGTELRPNIKAGQLQTAFIFNCREFQLHLALAMPEGTPETERFAALAEGFRRTPLIQAEDLPPRLQPGIICRQLHIMASDLLRRGKNKDVLLVLDDRVLSEATDLDLVKDAVLATAGDQDLNKAIQHLEKIQAHLASTGSRGLVGIDQFHAQLYKDWLREIINKGGYFSGTVAYEEASKAFPDDPEIHLLGVEIALAENNWPRARELLQQREYSAPLKERVDQLEARIKGMEDEEAVVIRFNPGDQHIRLDATLNGLRLQKFIVDTGADVTAIPSSAVELLKIKVDDSTPVRAVTTASGVELAPEIRLASIELEGCRVNDLRVLVIDLPGEPDVGILGLDFLKNFRYEIDNQRGILRLKKK